MIAMDHRMNPYLLKSPSSRLPCVAPDGPRWLWLA